jgi:hypothetical protein
MIGFLIKKTFFDLWDNLFKLALINLGFIASLAIPIFIPPLLESLPALALTVLGLGILWVCVYLAAAALSLKAVSDYGSFGFADFFYNLRLAWPAGLVLGGLVFAGWILINLVIPFYLSLNSLFGLFLTAVIFWTLVVGILALQFFLPIRARLDTKIIKIIKKSFIILFDNPGLCFFALIHNVVLLVLSVLLAFLIPGPAGILLFLDEALRLRLLKYDWLEANSDANRRKIPWDSLLIEEREKPAPAHLKASSSPGRISQGLHYALKCRNSHFGITAFCAKRVVFSQRNILLL